MTETVEHHIKDLDAYMNFIVNASIKMLRNNVRAMESVDTNKEYTYEINSMYASIDRLKRAE